MFSPLSESEYTIKSSKYFVEKTKRVQIPNYHLLVSFNVKSLFTKAPLDKRKEITLNTIYDKKEISTDILMLELEQSVIPILMGKMKCWTRYVDDTLCYIKTDSSDKAFKILNSFHRNIQLIYEVKTVSKTFFLDVLVISDSRNNINTTGYRKYTNNDIYLNWESFVRDKWKWGTLKILNKRAYDVCSTPELLQKGLNNIEKVFCINNNYTILVNKKVL